MEAPAANPVVRDARNGERQQDGGPRAAVILGNDAIAAIQPCSLPALIEACAAAGFDLVVPPSWGDELAAAEYLARLANDDDRAVIACACPRVRSLVARAPTEATPRAVSIAAPPVIAARYLRAVYGREILVTYVGDCPGAVDQAIDAQFSPSGFLASLHRQGIVIGESSGELSNADAVRWARHHSVSGGLPALRYLARSPVDRVLREVDDSALEAHRLPSSRSKMLLDLAAAAGCSCRVSDAEACELPRQAVPVVVAPAGLEFNAEASLISRRVARDAHHVTDTAPSPEPSFETAPEPEREPALPEPNDSPVAAEAPVELLVGIEPSGAVELPRSRDATLRSLFPPPDAAAPRFAAREARARAARPAPVIVPARGAGGVALTGIATIVLAAATALGVVVYLGVAGTSRTSRRPVATIAAGSVPLSPAPPAAPLPTAIDSVTTPVVAPDSIATDTSSAAIRRSVASDDSTRQRRALRPRRARPAEIVPGWLPQGDQRFSPTDTAATTRPTRNAPRIRPDTTPRT